MHMALHAPRPSSVAPAHVNNARGVRGYWQLELEAGGVRHSHTSRALLDCYGLCRCRRRMHGSVSVPYVYIPASLDFLRSQWILKTT
jgi:hypothetical protein